MLVLLDLRFYINSKSLQENDLSSSSVKTLGEAPDLVFGGRWRQTRKHLMFANKKTSEHSMFRNEKSSGNLKQIGNRIVARVPASLWRVAGNFFLSNHHTPYHVSPMFKFNQTYHFVINHDENYQVVWPRPHIFSSFVQQRHHSTLQCGRYLLHYHHRHHHPSSSIIININVFTQMHPQAQHYVTEDIVAPFLLQVFSPVYLFIKHPPTTTSCHSQKDT